MQAQLEAEKALWEEHQGRRPQPPGLSRTAFNLGSMFGSVRNAIIAGASSHGPQAGPGDISAGDGAVLPLDLDGLDEPVSRMPVCSAPSHAAGPIITRCTRFTIVAPENQTLYWTCRRPLIPWHCRRQAPLLLPAPCRHWCRFFSRKCP
jgi:hypothetical protein